MTRLQQDLQRASQALGLEIVVPYALAIQGVQITAQALLPQLGGEKGMIIVNQLEDLRGFEAYLTELGYGYSTIGDVPASEASDLESYCKMFSDWGWGSSK